MKKLSQTCKNILCSRKRTKRAAQEAKENQESIKRSKRESIENKTLTKRTLSC